MSKSLLTVCAFGLLLSAASAQDAEEEWKAWKERSVLKREITRLVPSGKTRPVWFLSGAWAADCSSWDIEVRTTRKPEHGTVEIVPHLQIGNFAKESLSAHCNGKKISGLTVNYKSSREYVGPDEFELLVMWPGSSGASDTRHSEIHFKMNVR